MSSAVEYTRSRYADIEYPKDLFGWQANSSEDRLKRPLVRKDGELVEASWDEAFERIVGRSKALLEEKGPLAFGFYTTGLAKLSSRLPRHHHRLSCPSSHCRRHLGYCRNPAPRTATSRLSRQGPDSENPDGSCVHPREWECFRLQVLLHSPSGISSYR